MIILSLFFVSCNLGTVNEQEEVNEESGGVGIEAHIYIPNWNAPKLGDSRVIDPFSTTIELYVYGDGTPIDTITFIPSGGVEVLSFSGLDAGTYNPGDLEITIYDDSYNALTTGSNLESVTLTPTGSNSIVFSSIPFNPVTIYPENASVAESLIDDSHVFMEMDVTAGNIYELIYERTSIGGDVDLYLYDEAGRFITSDVVIEGQNDPQTFVFVPESSGIYYLAFHAFAGSGNADFTYDLNHSLENGTLSLSGTLHFPAATAGTPVFIKATSGGVVTVLEKEIARNGDTTLDFLIPGFAANNYVSIFAVVDNDSSSHVGYVVGTQTDYTGSFGESLGADHRRDVDIYLEEIYGVTTTVYFPNSVPAGTPMYIAKVYDYGELTGSFGGFSVDSETGPWASDSFTTIAHPGTYRLIYIADLDNSGSGTSLSASNFYDIVTSGDYYFRSEEFTITDSDVTISTGTAYAASIITGSVILPEQESFFYYSVFGDDNTDVSDGVISADFGSYIGNGVYTSSFDYSLVIPEGSNLYVSAHVYFGYYENDLTTDDYYTFLDEENYGTYTNADIVPDLYVGGHLNRLTGTFQLPEGVDADGHQFSVGIINQDIWNAGVVPPETGAGGTFDYYLDGFELGEDLEVALFIDMDINGLDSSPNAGDVVGYMDEVVFDNPLGEILNFTGTFLADPQVFGSVVFPEYVSNKEYQIWLDGEPEDDGTVTGTSMNYDLMFVAPGTRTVTFVIDNNSDGIFGNSGDFLGRTDVYVEASDTTAPGITLYELGIVVEGDIVIPEDLNQNTDVYVVLLSTTDGFFYEYYEYLMMDENIYNDSISYRFENVDPDTYILYVLTDFNGNDYKDYGEYQGYYPYGLSEVDGEEIDIYQDIYDLNFNVDASSSL